MGENAAKSLQRMVSIVPVKGQSSKTEWLKSALRRSVGLLSSTINTKFVH